MMKTLLIAVMILATCLCSIVSELPEKVYCLEAVVVGVEQVEPDLWIVDCLGEDRNIWSFYDDCGEVNEGDPLVLTMMKTDGPEGIMVIDAVIIED